MAQSKIEMSARRGHFLSNKVYGFHDCFRKGSQSVTLEFRHNGGKIDAAIDDWECWEILQSILFRWWHGTTWGWPVVVRYYFFPTDLFLPEWYAGVTGSRPKSWNETELKRLHLDAAKGFDWQPAAPWQKRKSWISFLQHTHISHCSLSAFRFVSGR